jgi:HEAT repeat protein
VPRGIPLAAAACALALVYVGCAGPQQTLAQESGGPAVLQESPESSGSAEAAAEIALRRALSGVRPEADEVLPLLSDEDPVCRARALTVFLEDHELPAEAVPLLEDPDAGVREMALMLMTRRRAPGSVPALAGILAAEKPRLRAMAADALGASGETEAWGPLTEALAAGSSEVRKRAARALGTLWAGRWRGLAAPAPEAERAAVEALTEALSDADPDLRFHAAQVLAAMKAGEAVPAMTHAIDDTGGWQKVAMLRSISQTEDPAAADFLKKVFSEGASPEIRTVAGEGLVEMGLPAPGLWKTRNSAIWEAYGRRGEFANSPVVSLGVRPGVYLDPARLDSSLDLEACGVDLTHTRRTEGSDPSFSLWYARFREAGTGGDVRCFVADWGHAMSSRPSGDPRRHLRWIMTSLSQGPSALVLHSEADERTTYGLGWFLRGGLDLVPWRNCGLNLYLDLHGWWEGDREDQGLAGSASVGVNATFYY